MQCQRLKRLSRGGILIKEKAGNRLLQGNPWPGRVQTERMCPISESYCMCMYARVCVEGCAVLCCAVLSCLSQLQVHSCCHCLDLQTCFQSPSHAGKGQSQAVISYLQYQPLCLGR